MAGWHLFTFLSLMGEGLRVRKGLYRGYGPFFIGKLDNMAAVPVELYKLFSPLRVIELKHYLCITITDI